ncbi:MAG: lipid-A-disaccharide synthase [Paludibacteraceae bacterium]|nr:lipid-A-disaccharide synthase [Paludibacteraceae bacterium]
MKYFLIAGEASGDLHASRLIQALSQKDRHADFAGMGGDKMQQAGCRLVQHYREMAFMGIVAVLRNLNKVRRNFRIARQNLIQMQPDVLILIDYPSFNLRMAAFCHKHLPHTKIVYYIPPKVWAWKSWRVHKIARYSDLILGIFPFEETYYARYGYRCRYVGNPTVDSIRDYLDTHPNATDAVPSPHPHIAILPGSRKSEITNCLPTMLQAARIVQEQHPDYRIAVTAAPSMPDAFYRQWLTEDILLTRDTYGTVQRAQVAIVNSGTATLETALLGCPLTAVYHIATSRFFGKHVVNLFKHFLFHDGYFTLVNILLRKEAIQELIAERFTATNIAYEVNRLLDDNAYRKAQKDDLQQLQAILGTQPAAKNAAQAVIELINA